MTALRRRMIEDMLVRSFSPNTQKSYVHYVAELARQCNTSPEYLGFEHVRSYQVYLAEQRQLSPASINTFVSAVQFLYTVTLEVPWGTNRFVRMKVPETLPMVLSRGEIELLFRHGGFLTHRAVLMLCYGSGRRGCWSGSREARVPKTAIPFSAPTCCTCCAAHYQAQRPTDNLFRGVVAGVAGLCR